MVKIRLKRMGMKKKPFYRVVVADERASRDGRFIDELGYYNPVSNPVELKIDAEKASSGSRTALSRPIPSARCSRRAAPSPNRDVIGRSPERQA